MIFVAPAAISAARADIPPDGGPLLRYEASLAS